MKRLLYVEDDAINAFVLKKLLSRDFEVIHVSDGEKCMEEIVDKFFDAVLLDINLGAGKMDGIETLKLLRKTETYRSTPVFAVTSYAMPEDEERFLSEGFDAYFSKPVDREELIRRLRQILF